MVRVEIRDGEDFEHALDRFQQLVQSEFERPWTKRRYGYYEKPSALRRKQEKMRWLRAGRSGHLWLRIALQAQFQRTGPTNAAGQ